MNIIMIDNDNNFCDNLIKYFRSNGELGSINVFNDGVEATDYAIKNSKMLELVLIDLEVPNMDIPYLVDNISNQCNIIAFSDNPSTLKKYINYPYFQRIFEKPIAYSTILNYLHLQNGVEPLENLKKNVLKSLSKIGFALNHAGTSYLAEATAISMRTKIKKLSDVYTLIAYNHNCDPKIIGWSINNAINKAVKSSVENQLQDFFKMNDNRKLTAKYIVNYFLSYSSKE